ncbi:hypothetical protein [Candidatus Palauibacter sp.]|uniref:hypothetical protein n=1 Tax=Candidatus Palauibacter sp. TaxID=3101350 RepID=UPI003B02E42B
MSEFVQELPPGGILSHDIFLERARGFDLFGDTVAIADRLAGRVQLFRSKGEHIATLGGPLGPGDPEILQSPWRVEFAPDGTLWVGDPGRGALVGFPLGGGEPQTAQLPVATTAGFGVDHVLGPVGASAHPGFLLTAYAVADRPLNIPSEVPLPSELAYGPDRISPGHLVVSGGRRGEVILLDAIRTSLWRIGLEYEPPRIVDISRIPVPAWLVKSVRADMELMAEAFPGAVAPGFKDMRAGDRGVWLVPGLDTIDGVFVPYEADGRVTVLWRDPLQEEAWSSRVLDDAAWLMYPASLRLFTIADED